MGGGVGATIGDVAEGMPDLAASGVEVGGRVLRVCWAMTAADRPSFGELYDVDF